MPRTSHIRAGLAAAVKATVATLALAAAAGCGFNPGGGRDDGDDDDIVTIDAAIDSPIDGVTYAPLCEPDDPDLRLCLDFEGTVDTKGNAPLSIDSMNVVFGDGAVGGSVMVTSASVIHVAESPALDISAAMTLEAFVQIHDDPVPAPRAGVLDNNGQYGLWIDPSFTPYCTLAGSTVTGNPMVPGSWVHVACVFDGATFSIFQGGTLVRQVNRVDPVSTAGADGLNVGQDCRGPDMSGDPLNGAIDELRLWSVARTPAQIAEASARP